ncbi:MAG: response regulator [Methylococcaceae bacterium]
MSNSLPLIRINPDDIREDQPVPFDVYTVTGALLITRNQPLTYPEQLPILKSQGWRKPVTTEEVAQAKSREEPKAESYDFLNKTTGTQSQDIELPDDGLRLPSRGRPPLDQAEALIAEDVRLARRLLAHMVSEQGLKKVEFAEDGRDAVNYFFHRRPHLVFLDIDMPNLNGLEVLKQIKLWMPDSFTCIVSGHGTMANARVAKNSGVDGFLIKPINVVNLKRVLSVYVRSGSMVIG